MRTGTSMDRRRALALLAAAPAIGMRRAFAQGAAPYVVGAILNLTGIDSGPGLSAAAALDAVDRHINAGGGIDRHPLEIRILDDAGNPDRALDDLKRFASEDEILAIIGASGRATAQALEGAANEAKIPFLSLAPRTSGDEVLLPWVFRLAVPDPTRIGLLIDYAKRHALQRLAVLFSDDDYGRSAANLANTLAASAGLTIVDAEALPPDGRDQPAVVRAESKGPQGVLAFVSGQPALVAKAMAASAPGLPALSDVPAATAEFLHAAGKEANAWRVAAPKVAVWQLVAASDPLRTPIAGFVKLYARNDRPDAIAGTARDALMMLVRAISAGASDRAKIRAALEDGKPFVGVMGAYRMTPANHGEVDGQGLLVIEGDGGRWKRAD